MKKWFITCIAVVMVFAMTSTAFAAVGSDTAAKGITKKQAVSIALKDAGLTKAGVYNLEADYDDEDNIYEVEFIKKKNKAEYDYEISARNGKIMEKSVDFKYKRNHSKSKISKSEARKIVAKHAKVSLDKVKSGKCIYEYDYEDREGTYEIKFRDGKVKYDYELLAPTGKIIEYGYKVIK